MAVWAIDGATSPASVARIANFHAVKGEAGIILPTDHRVTALPTPGAAVLVSPGGTSLKNTYVEGAQNYLTGDAGAVTVPVPATGSSGGAVRYVVKTVRDPKYAGVTLDQRGYDFFDVVDSNDLVTYGHPYYALARIDQPASTATITDGSGNTLNMITPLQEVANPREKTELRSIQLTSGQSATLSSSATYPDGQTFPVETEAAWGEIPIPSWATRMHVIMTWAGVYAPGGDVYGYTWVQVAPTVNTAHVNTQGVWYDTTGVVNGSDKVLRVAQNLAVPADLRGTSQKFYPRGNVLGGSAWLELNSGSALDLMVVFQEVAD